MALVVCVLCAPTASAPVDKAGGTFPLIEDYIQAGKVRRFTADA